MKIKIVGYGSVGETEQVVRRKTNIFKDVFHITTKHTYTKTEYILHKTLIEWIKNEIGPNMEILEKNYDTR